MEIEYELWCDHITDVEFFFNIGLEFDDFATVPDNEFIIGRIYTTEGPAVVKEKLKTLGIEVIQICGGQEGYGLQVCVV